MAGGRRRTDQPPAAPAPDLPTAPHPSAGAAAAPAPELSDHPTTPGRSRADRRRDALGDDTERRRLTGRPAAAAVPVRPVEPE
ncbi:hypothetical protein, partial [Geodermatophilus aquaeductus]